MALPVGTAQQVSEAADVLRRPLDYASLNEWRHTVIAVLTRLFHGDMGHVSLKGYGLSDERLATGYPDGVFEEYVSEWVARDPTYPLMSKLALTSYTRRKRHELAGPLWYARYRRSEVFNQFYAKHGLIDGAGVYLQAGDKVAHFHVEPVGEGSDMFGPQGERALALLEPAFRNTAALLPDAQRSNSAWMLDALLATDDRPIALFSPRAQLLHASKGYDTLLEQLSATDATTVRETIGAHVTRCLSKHTHQHATQLNNQSTQHRITLRNGSSISVASILCQSSAMSLHSMVVIRLRHWPRGSVDAALPVNEATLRKTFNLTQRQLEVALLIARGKRSSEIAQTLGVKACTAARHTETVLRKLKVPSRGGVAAALFLHGNNPNQ